MGHNSVAELYTGVEMTGQPVTVVVLRAQAGADHAVRSAFAEAVNRGSYSSDPGQLPIHAADLSAAQPWAASYQSPGRLGAERALDGLPGGGALETMSYQVPWAGRRRPALPRRRRAGRPRPRRLPVGRRRRAVRRGRRRRRRAAACPALG